ncbi:MAG: RHS repeat-associated core domain-containing protein [bacterium]|nr:RHS repeat-associated core domain-containing protein [bacterium]
MSKYAEGMSLRCDVICALAYCDRHESSHIIKVHTDSARRLFVEICVNSWHKNLRKNIRVIRRIRSFKAKLQISTNFHELFWTKWPVSQYFYIPLPICVPKTFRVMTASNPHRHIKKRLMKTVEAHTPCSCGYMQDGELYFYIKDYQGNIRVVLNQSNQPIELNSYYPYGGLMAATTEGSQPYKYGAKELDRENGLDLYDSQARHYDPILPRTTTMDPLAEKYYSLSPYTWCAANPTRYIDPNGEKVELYATSLPGCELPLATHTFIVIRDQHNKVKGYYAYGSEYDGIKGCISGQLKRMSYHQDKMVYSGKDTEHLKKIIEIEPPSGMSETEFDHKVESVANSFGNNKQITYHFAPTISDMTEGNCNTSTSTILLKSGVSKSSIQNIKKEIPGISLGFSIIARPWTKQEQKNAVKYQEAADFLIDIISNP